MRTCAEAAQPPRFCDWHPDATLKGVDPIASRTSRAYTETSQLLEERAQAARPLPGGHGVPPRLREQHARLAPRAISPRTIASDGARLRDPLRHSRGRPLRW